MNEEPTVQYATSQPQPQKSHKMLKGVAFALVCLALVGAIGYGTAYVWRKYATVKSDLSSEQAKNLALTAQNAQLQTQIAVKPTTVTVSQTLTGGKTLSYPLSPSNAQIIVWQDSSEAVIISHKQALSYVSSLTSDMRKTICASDTPTSVDQKDIAMGSLTISTKTLVHNQYSNCLQSMASTTLNKDTTSQIAAKKVLDQVNADIDAFVSSTTIK
jgi:hypothetical protein